MTLEERLHAAAAQQGILAQALPDAIARGQARFSLPPTDNELAAWAQSLHATCPHFFPPPAAPAPVASDTPPGVPEATWRGMSPSSKLAWARAHGYGLPVVERRPKPIELSAEQVATLSALPPAQRMTAYRELQAQQQGKG